MQKNFGTGIDCMYLQDNSIDYSGALEHANLAYSSCISTHQFKGRRDYLKNCPKLSSRMKKNYLFHS